jgi:hypothetical protein
MRLLRRTWQEGTYEYHKYGYSSWDVDEYEPDDDSEVIHNGFPFSSNNFTP